MLWSMEFGLWSWIILQLLSSGVYAAHNVTVDDADSSITYVGTWLTTDSTDHYLNTCHYTYTKGSYATFSFTGATQIYFMGYGLPRNAVDTTIAIVFDGETHIVDIYRTLDVRLQAILWSRGNLDPNTMHTIECLKISDDDGGRALKVDAFILTIPDVSASSSVSSVPSISSSSRTTAVNSVNQSGGSATVAGAATIAGAATVASGAMTSHLSNVVWNPSMDVDTANNPGSTPESQSNGAVQASIGESPRSNALPKSAIVGICLGAIGLIGLIAIIFFYLGRRRNPPQQLEASRVYYLNHHESNEDLKQRQHSHEPSLEQGPSSPISNGNTGSHSGHIRDPTVDSDGAPDGSESNAWGTNPPAYTARPISGHYTALRIGGASIPRWEARRIRDTKEG